MSVAAEAAALRDNVARALREESGSATLRRPIKQLSGRSEFNEVFITDLRIPDANRVGEIGQGWEIVLSGLGVGRFASVGGSAAILGGKIAEPLTQLAAEVGADSAFRRKIADYAAMVAGIDNLYAWIVEAISQGKAVGLEGSIAKLALTRGLQELSILALDQAGTEGIVSAAGDSPLGRIQDSFLMSAAFRIGGGAEKINLNMIAERVLGLPKG